mgnify:CR=1 FL=1
MARWSRNEREEASSARRLVAALALFAVVCGAILLLVGGGAPDGDGDAPDRRAARAIEQLDRAAAALEADNYGRTRIHILRARMELGDDDVGRGGLGDRGNQRKGGSQ